MIEEGVYLFGPQNGWDYYVNHSCDPTVWMADEVAVIARRTILPGEEICGHYAVWESNPAYRVDPCQCGTPQCRDRFSGEDWQRAGVQARYRDHFLPYITRRITRLRE